MKNQTLIQTIVQIGHEKKIPVFSVDRKLEGCYNITLDYGDGFEAVVRHVVEDHGARRVNMIAGYRNNDFSEQRVSAYKKVLQENGIQFEPERLGYGEFWDRPTRDVVNAFFESDLEMPEAIICANDAMALTVCSMLYEAGYSVPDDIIVTGFDGTQVGKYYSPVLTTGEPDYHKAAEDIFQNLFEALESGEVRPSDNYITFTLSRNQSCGCFSRKQDEKNQIIATLYEDVGDCAWHNIEMKKMLMSVGSECSVNRVMAVLPKSVKLWNDHFRFACVKTELMDSYQVPDQFRNMTTILRLVKQEFQPVGSQFDISEFIPNLEEVLNWENGEDILVVRLLNAGKKAYGYTVEGMCDMDDRRLQRCNEFAMFLSHAISTVLHNCELLALNEDLMHAYDEISALYLQDSMTGIYNRRGFYQKLNEILKIYEGQEKYLYVISADMDGLKKINDTYGHAEGDFAIITLARAIADIVDNNGVCARFGGDEFVCVLIVEKEEDLSFDRLVRKIQNNIANTVGVSEKPYRISASLGVSCHALTAAVNAEDLIHAADKKMYEDKVSRKQQRQ
ncbi:MAG: GGDEF domain-containing protein [Clostridiaceae bacterium]|nr:GGDEF domain-containing protein [Clostridiaceae bacterium]